MVAAVLKLYFIGTALSVLAVLFGIVDSFGGLMYAQDQLYILELDHQTITRGAGLHEEPPEGLVRDQTHRLVRKGGS